MSIQTFNPFISHSSLQPQMLRFAGRRRPKEKLTNLACLKNANLPVSAPVAIVEAGSNALRAAVLIPANDNASSPTVCIKRISWNNGEAIGRNASVEGDYKTQYTKTLEKMQKWLTNKGIQNINSIPAISTAGIRSAANGNELLNIASDLGFEFKLIDGCEEARLCYLAALKSEKIQPAQKTIVFDIGGGSTVFGCGVGATGFDAKRWQLMEMGTSRTGGIFPLNSKSVLQVRRKAQKEIRTKLSPRAKYIAITKNHTAFIKESTLKALADIHRRKGFGQDILRDAITREEIEYYLSKDGLQAIARDRRVNAELPNQKAQCKLVTKLSILAELMEHMQFKQIELGSNSGPQLVLLDEQIAHASNKAADKQESKLKKLAAFA